MNIIKVIKSMKIKFVGQLAHAGDMRNEYKIVIEKPEGKRKLGKPGDRWEY
jgi:hypothetical protein